MTERLGLNLKAIEQRRGLHDYILCKGSHIGAHDRVEILERKGRGETKRRRKRMRVPANAKESRKRWNESRRPPSPDHTTDVLKDVRQSPHFLALRLGDSQHSPYRNVPESKMPRNSRHWRLAAR